MASASGNSYEYYGKDKLAAAERLGALSPAEGALDATLVSKRRGIGVDVLRGTSGKYSAMTQHQHQ